MLIVDALRALHKKATSKDSSSSSIAGIVFDMAENWSAGGGEAGPPGPQGVGIKTITGSIDSSNHLTLTFTLTDDTQQTVTGAITPPAAG